MTGSRASLGSDDGAECLGEDELLRYVEGALGPKRMAAVRSHVDACEECRSLLAIVGREAAAEPVDDADASLRVGDVVDQRFLIESEIGRGAMGIVYAAKHLSLERPVALKVISEGLTRDDDTVRRFIRESRIAATFQSPHVAKVLDVGRLPNGAPYMAMERLAGESLEAIVLREGPLEVARAVDYIAQACDALGEAHALSVVHRDVKLGNLFLAEDAAGAIVKVLDFGLATKGQAISDASLTPSYAMMGTPRYMSPEQIGSAKDVDARSDVWALGVCLYRLLTAHYPYDGPHLAALCIKIATAGPTKPTVWRADLPPSVESVVLRCLARDRNARFADARELGEALSSILTMRHVSATVVASVPLPTLQRPEPREASSIPHATQRLTGPPRPAEHAPRSPSMSDLGGARSSAPFYVVDSRSSAIEHPPLAPVPSGTARGVFVAIATVVVIALGLALFVGLRLRGATAAGSRVDDVASSTAEPPPVVSTAEPVASAASAASARTTEPPAAAETAAAEWALDPALASSSASAVASTSKPRTPRPRRSTPAPRASASSAPPTVPDDPTATSH